jgi:hypothetical protein
MNELSVRSEELKAEVAPIVERASSLVVQNPDQHADALILLARVRAAKKTIKARTEPAVETARAAWKASLALQSSFLDPLDEADILIVTKAGAFEAVERKAADAQRARLMAEAVAAQEEQRELDAAMADTEAGAEEALTAPLPPPVVEVAPDVAKVDGVSSRTTWAAEVVDKAAFVRWCAADPSRLYMVDVNMPHLHSRARGERDALKLPGIKAVQKIGYAAR